MVVKCADFQPEKFFQDVPLLKNRRGNPAGKKRKYLGLTTAFDIETTVIDEITQAVMYIWMWQFGEDITVIGRTWEEFINLQKTIKNILPSERWLVVYVHVLSHEFQYLKSVYSFTPDEVFAIDSRKVLKCDMYNCFEFRCSYKLTNMSLAQFTKKMKVKHQKLSGDEFDYQIKRYYWTELTPRELEYCINDVQGLVEAINATMARDGDTLQTIPLTSTGYVRRNVKRAMRNGIHHNYVYSLLPDFHLYEALDEAMRGGNTHANRYYSGDIVAKVHSKDESSAYPFCVANKLYPCTPFIPIAKSDLNIGYITRCIKIRGKALLLRVAIKNLRLRDPFWPVPYLSTSKCRNIQRPQETEDNGRLLACDYLETTLTDLDLKIVLEEYEGELFFLEGWFSSYKPLPQPIVDEIIKYYREKTELKGVKGQEAYYDKSKALLNSIYGLMAQNPVKHQYIFQQVGDWEEDTISDEEILEKHNQKAFLPFQWGVWTTAHSRDCLERGIRLIHEASKIETPNPEDRVRFLYCDTDSLKHTGEVDFSEYNKSCIEACKNSGSYAVDPSGVTHYMGVFESEDNKETGYSYRYFKTLGAKKYAFNTGIVQTREETLTIGDRKYSYRLVSSDFTDCTIAGVNKKKGGRELDKYGGLKAFEEGFTFREAGGTMSVYNDDPPIKSITIDGHVQPIISNVAILPSEYTVGITGEYERIIKFSKNYLNNPYIL